MNRSTARRTVTGLVAAGLLTAAGVAVSPAAEAATGTVIATVNLNVRSSASTSASVIGTVAPGSIVSFSCYEDGTAVTGPYGTETAWDKLDTGGFVADAWIDTGHNTPVVPKCGASSAPSTATAPSSGKQFRVAWSLIGIFGRVGTSMSSAKVGGVLSDGTLVTVVCETTGETLTNSHGDTNNLWDLTANGTYLPNVYLNTGTNGRTPGVSQCDTGQSSASGSSTSPGSGITGGSGYYPTAIHLRATAGEREKNLLALGAKLNTAARSANVSGQTLARIIYHEGGNYLTYREAATQQAEMVYAGSVGIGQIRPSTAKLVALKIFRDWATLNNEDLVVRTNLIYNTDFALKYAAGYVALLEQAGISGSYQLFMSYCLSVASAQAWKASGYTLDSKQLARINIDANTLAARSKAYYTAVDAIG